MDAEKKSQESIPEKFLKPYDPTATEHAIYERWVASGFFNPETCVGAGVTKENAEPIRKPRYDFTLSDRTGWEEPIPPGQVVILEGLLLFALQELRELLDVKIFVDTDADIRILRRIRRDTRERGRSLESVMDQYENSVRPMHLEFVEPSKRWADLIVPTGVENSTALDIITHHLCSRVLNREGVSRV